MTLVRALGTRALGPGCFRPRIWLKVRAADALGAARTAAGRRWQYHLEEHQRWRGSVRCRCPRTGRVRLRSVIACRDWLMCLRRRRAPVPSAAGAAHLRRLHPRHSRARRGWRQGQGRSRAGATGRPAGLPAGGRAWSSTPRQPRSTSVSPSPTNPATPSAVERPPPRSDSPAPRHAFTLRETLAGPQRSQTITASPADTCGPR
jgi:hypothetical protein